MITLWNSARVRRWHMHPEMSATDDFVDGHSARVARMVAYLGLPHHAVTAALFHDDEEAAYGDISSPAKVRGMGTYEVYKSQVLHTDGIDPTGVLQCIPGCSDAEAGVIQMCDRLDAEIWISMHTRSYDTRTDALRAILGICRQLMARNPPGAKVCGLLPCEIRKKVEGTLFEEATA